MSDVVLPSILANRRVATRLRWFFQHGSGTQKKIQSVSVEDIALIEAGYIARCPPSIPGCLLIAYAITPEGEHAALALRRHDLARLAPHHELGSSLARFLNKKGRVTWENSAFEGEDSSVRPDVYSLMATLNPDRLAPMVHEIKVSRADFQADLRSPSKRAGYFCIAPQVFYAAPEGLLAVEDIPPECGFMEYVEKEDAWITRKRAPKNKSWSGISSRTWMGLVLKNHVAPDI